ncbi:methyl-accepting chemotaxis protein [Rhodoferax sp.]|uniref:methyl-accepting chemotaxis protein n=1 Tax=Rhodoferax sp. TaxID=50421 RepID=UPI0025D75A3C|nr:methyl-accepting chemotaxis protein [Rhodoferax sp.]
MKSPTIARRLQWIIGMLGGLLLAIGALGLTGLSASNASLKTVYEDRVIALGQLGEVARLLQRNRNLLADFFVPPGITDRQERLAEFDANLLQLMETWQAYQATYLTPEEQTLARGFLPVYNSLRVEGLQAVRDALGRGDLDTGARLYQEKVKPLMPAAMAVLAQLDQIQYRVSKEEYESALDSYETMRWICLWAIAGGLAAATLLGWYMVRTLHRQLGAEPSEVLSITSAVARGDLTSHIQVPPDAPESVMAGMERMQLALQTMVGTVREGSESVASGSSQIASGSGDLSSRTERQASALEQTAASMEQLSATVRQNADSAQEAYQLAHHAAGLASDGGQVVSEVVSTMQKIDEASRRMAAILGVIDGIAFQTNILALNAAVEAARAGEQGRGFAVVASEVRSLAGRSAEAAKEIKLLIAGNVQHVGAGSQQVQQAGLTMHSIVESIRQVSELMDTIRSASAEQASGVSQIGEAVGHMDQTTQQNAALVEEMSAAAASLKARAQQLVQSVAAFRTRGGAGGGGHLQLENLA